MRIRHFIAACYWKVSRWRLESEPLPPGGKAVFVAAPHTSNWDFVLMLAVVWFLRLDVFWLGKNSLFKRPFGGIMRALGGVAVDRRSPHGMVNSIAERAAESDSFYLVITPEGTRSHTDYWKSGFYRIALDTGLPVIFAHVDHAKRTIGVGPYYQITGDVSADMDVVRAIYESKRGVKPGKESRVRLRIEDESVEDRPEPSSTA